MTAPAKKRRGRPRIDAASCTLPNIRISAADHARILELLEIRRAGADPNYSLSQLLRDLIRAGMAHPRG